MGKELHVYLNSNEVKMLEDFCEEHGCSQSAIVKAAIHSLAADHGSAEHNGHEPRIVFPTEELLRTNVVRAMKEGKELQKKNEAQRYIEDREKAQELERQKNIKETAKEITEYVMGRSG